MAGVIVWVRPGRFLMLDPAFLKVSEFDPNPEQARRAVPVHLIGAPWGVSEVNGQTDKVWLGYEDVGAAGFFVPCGRMGVWMTRI